MNLFDLVLPSLWIMGKLPEKDGEYRCRLKKKGDFEICNVTFREGRFVTEHEVIAWEI